MGVKSIGENLVKSMGEERMGENFVKSMDENRWVKKIWVKTDGSKKSGWKLCKNDGWWVKRMGEKSMGEKSMDENLVKSTGENFVQSMD